jgi:threonine dehydrogenase-like Zn-dependent dehydrogenase
MKALLFQFSLPRMAYAKIVGALTQRAYVSRLSPLTLAEIPMPRPPAPDWAILRTQVCGICGSDTKQIFLDAEFDNPLRTMVSFPHVLGHEAVGVIEQIGEKAAKRKVGERVALNPWLSCAPRGIDPMCPACQKGLYCFCQHFHDGDLPTAIHIGNCPAVNGGFAPYFSAHESQLFPVPDEVSNDQAVLADPFSVSLHAILKSPPPPGGTALVYGCGTLGILTVAALCSIYPGTQVIVIARQALQEKLAYNLGAAQVLRTRDLVEIIESVAQRFDLKPERPPSGLPWLLGGVDVIYDTIGSAETIEVGLRVTRPRGSIVVTGVSRPRRFEWTPHYFKEIALIGSNAFGVEDFEGDHLHAFEIFFRLLQQKRLKLPPMVTHRFRLEQYQEALLLAENKDRHQAVKVIFDFQDS